MVWTQAKEYWQPPEAGRGKKQILPGASRRNLALLTPYFWPSDIDFNILASTTTNEYIPVILSLQVCDNLFQGL